MDNFFFLHDATAVTFAQVKWKGLYTGLWKGPDPILIWGRGHVCVFFSQEESRA